MSARQPNVRRYGLAGILVLLVILLPGDLWSQQERLGRQSDLTAQELTTIRDQIRELNGRAIIGFKPVDAVQGMRPDGTPALAPAAVAQLATDLAPLGVRVTTQFRIIPAVAAVIDPDRLEELLANPNIDYVEPDYLNEPTAQTTPWGITRVNAPTAWAFTKGSGASVGIMDTGIDEDHPDLNPINGINLVTGGTARSDWDDNSPICIASNGYHGTHVAGTVAALDNAIGVVGVAPEASLYALRVFDPEGAGLNTCTALTSDIVEAIQWATTNGLDVINMSFRNLYPAFAEADALFAAYSADVFPVAGAGNDYLSGQIGFPAGFPHAIAVAAINSSDEVVSFSNTGPEIELAAPGYVVYSTLGGGEYGFKSGTSMASPHVAGVAALVRAAQPDLGVDEVRQVLRSTAQDIDATGFDWASGYGVVDAGAAVAAVASSNLLLSLHPGELTLAVEPGGSAIVTPVEVRNVGVAGTINWSATDDASWITLSPTSGSASDVTPGQFNLTADPTGLSVGFYTGFVTVTGNAANSPVTLRVRLAVAPRIALDAGVTTEGTLPYGERVRYLLAGTAGQKIDVAVLTDYSAAWRLDDPVVRVYMPDGETLLARSDHAFDAGLGFQALVYRDSLPVTGDYVVEVGAWNDAEGGGYLLKARPAGPILGFSPWYIFERGERNGSSVNTSITVFNLSGLGTLDWTCSSPDPWISCSPTSGTVSQTGTLVTLDDFTTPEVAEEIGGIEQSEVSSAHPDVALPLSSAFVRALLGTGDYEVPDERLAEPDLAWVQAAARGNRDPPRLAGEVQGTSVTVTLDPSGLPLRFNYGNVLFQPADGWLENQTVEVIFYVYSEGMEIISSNHDTPWGMATGDTRDGPPNVMVATRDDGGSLIPILPDGTVGAPIATGIGRAGGLTLGQDANWYVGVFDPCRLRKVEPDGTVSDFKALPDRAVYWLTWGPDDDLYGSSSCRGEVYRIPLDGTAEEPIPVSLPFCVGGVAYRPQDNSLYVGDDLLGGLVKVSLDDWSSTTLASSVDDVHAVAVGRSGLVYFTDETGLLWSIDPDMTSTATQLALTPTPIPDDDPRYHYGLALTEGALMISEQEFGELYRYPIDDGPIPHPAEEALYVARFAPEDMRTMEYPDVGDPSAMQGEDFELTQILYSKDGSDLPVATFVEEVAWDPVDIAYVDMFEGDFGGTLDCDESQVDEGALACSATRAEPVGVPGVSLLGLRLNLSTALAGGACVPIEKAFSELSGSGGEDYLPVLETTSPLGIGVREWPYGDVTRDDTPTVGVADVVQILRHLVDLSICANCDISLGDVDRDASVTGMDAVYVLRWLVGIGVPNYHRIDMYGLQECQVP